MIDWSRLFPPSHQTYTGPRGPDYFLVLVAMVSTARSLIHVLAPDGGAASIAGINVAVEGGRNVVAIFGQWGAMQLIVVLMQWLVLLRYRFLVPAMLGVAVLEQLLRMGVGRLKPVQVSSPPPGALGSLLLLPLAVIAFLWSLRRRPG